MAVAGVLLIGASGSARADGEGGTADGGLANSVSTLLPAGGDPGGHRKVLAERGIVYGLNYVSDIFGNASGGERRGKTYLGRVEGFVDADFEKLAGAKGLTFHANAYQIHGHGLSREYIGNLMPIAANEALATTRLFELWFEQRLANDLVSVRFGQLAADAEFIGSSWAGQFVNNTFGWPTIAAEALPSGGPAYPMTTPGVRLKVDPSKSVSALVGLYNGDPGGPGPGDGEARNRYGVRFPVQGPPLLIGELQYRYNQDKTTGGAGTVKLGAFHHFGDFDDYRFGTDGIALADTVNSNGAPIRHGGNTAVYGIVDQQIWRPSSGEPDKGVGLFVRAQAAPSDRNLIDLYVDGGIVFAGLVPRRPDDSFGFGAAYARMSDGARNFDRDSEALAGSAQPIRSYEALFEANYTAQIVTGWTLTLDAQYVVNPGGHVPDPNDSTGLSALGNAAVFGLHSAVKY